MRSSGFGLLNATGRLSSLVTTYVTGALLEVAVWAPLLMAAVLLAIGSAAMLVLPEPAGALPKRYTCGAVLLASNPFQKQESCSQCDHGADAIWTSLLYL